MNFKRKNINNIEHFNKKMKEELDPFEQDAIEGWQELSADDLKRLDSRYARNTLLMNISLAVLFFTAFAISIFSYENYKNTIRLEQNKPSSNTIEKTKVQKFIPIKLPNKTIELIASNEQVQPNKIKTDQKILHQPEENPSESESLEKRNLALSIEPISIASIATVKTVNLAKETYVQNLLVVDYRYYRGRDPLNLKKELTGTPADVAFSIEKTESKNELEISYMNFLSKTLSLFNQKKYQDCISNFETILSKYPDDINALFYESICLYNLGLNKEARTRLRQLEMNPFSNFYEEQQWYLLLCYRAEKDLEKYNRQRAKVISAKGYYWLRAQELE